MSTPQYLEPVQKVRVSILERVVPFFSFGLAVCAVLISSYQIISFLTEFPTSGHGSMADMTEGLVKSSLIPLFLLCASLGVGFIGIIISVARMFVTTNTASPSGISFIVLGLMSLMPITLYLYALSLIMTIFNPVEGHNLGVIGGTVAEYLIIVVLISAVTLLALILWSFLPFKAFPGRRFGPLISLILIQTLLMAATVHLSLSFFELIKINEANSVNLNS